MIDANALVGTHDVLFVTLDTLRYDVAVQALSEGSTPNFARILPQGKWEKRHTPGNFTYSAHHAFFAGFLPTPAAPGKHSRLFATRFDGSETTSPQTCVFDAPDIITGFALRGYHTICVGGVGFFNKRNPMGCVLPGFFQESHWSPEMGVTDRHSTENQVHVARQAIEALPKERRLFLFVNVSALHQPNCIFLEGATSDSLLTHRAALEYVDECMPSLFTLLQRRARVICIVCSDHGTAYGEDGYFGHRLCHPVIWEVPYAEFVLPERRA
ncbi:MAG TPA: STM4013/SEN3800 family hydrolase [Planctomycetota bacterium]|jgi:hypothetical protein